MKIFFYIVFAFVGICCNNKEHEKKEVEFETTGSIEKYDSELDSIISIEEKPAIIASGFKWSEGPLWVESEHMLLFSDVPVNTIYKWTEEKGKEIYLKPSGYTGLKASVCKEPGSNGLILDNNGNLILCQHGDRRVASMNASLNKPEPKFSTLAHKFKGKQFSSPNDAVLNKAGELFFTDPPYGLQTQNDTDSKKETNCNGVYKVKKDGTVILLVDTITRPNGLAFINNEQKLVIACSDPNKPNWYVFDVIGDSLKNGKIFYSAVQEAKLMKGLPDGLKVNRKGYIFATGPGGIYVFGAEGKKLGLIKLDNPASNCALSANEKVIYITNSMYLLRIKLK